MKYSNIFSALCIASLTSLGVSALPSKAQPKPTAIEVLTFALTLEHLENAYYSTRLALYSEADFIAAGYPEWVHGRFEQIHQHESAHVKFLSTAISAAGGKVPQPCEYKFPDHDVKSFIELSSDFESVGTSAYNGAIGLLSDNEHEYATVAGSIFATEARQSAWIDSAVLNSYPWSTSFETPLTADQAFTIASGFIVKCPSDNPPLIAHPFHMLTVSSATPGEDAQLSFDNSGHKGKQCFAAFLTGTGSSFVPINDEGKVKVPEGLIGTVYVLVSSSGSELTDETIIAGPAIARYSYPSSA